MNNYLMIYGYVGEIKDYFVEGSDEDYLKAKVPKYVELTGKNIRYKIFKKVNEGVLNHIIEEKTCEDCGYCKVYPKVTYCVCHDKGGHEIINYNEAESCNYYDDENWMK